MVPSRAATRRAASSKASEISMVVFIWVPIYLRPSSKLPGLLGQDQSGTGVAFCNPVPVLPFPRLQPAAKLDPGEPEVVAQHLDGRRRGTERERALVHLPVALEAQRALPRTGRARGLLLALAAASLPPPADARDAVRENMVPIEVGTCPIGSDRAVRRARLAPP